MRTKVTIVLIILGCMALTIAALAVATIWFGWWGLGASLAFAGIVVLVYIGTIRPWHARWGATDEEVRRPMPGDEIVPGANSTTRAISIHSTPEEVWPWLVQIGYGRAGWYSYDWIDNDGRPSAKTIVPELQQLNPGDQIAMLPGYGPHVIQITPPRYLVTGDSEGGSWCLAVYPAPNGCRLVSRWRQSWETSGVASWFFITFADPGAFIMERKMLRGIKRRAESNGPAPQQRRNAGARSPQEEVA